MKDKEFFMLEKKSRKIKCIVLRRKCEFVFFMGFVGFFFFLFVLVDLFVNVGSVLGR